VAYLAARFAIIDEMGFVAGGEQRGTAADMFRRVYWDTALSGSEPVLRMLRDVAGIDQVLYGTDFPYLRRDLAVRSKTQILESSGLDDLGSRAILGSNASQLFPRLQSIFSNGDRVVRRSSRHVSRDKPLFRARELFWSWPNTRINRSQASRQKDSNRELRTVEPASIQMLR